MSADLISRFPIYFREQDLSKAYAFAATLEEGSAPEETPSDLDVATEEVYPGWTRDEAERAYRESPLGMKLLFDGMIDHPDEVLDANDFARFLTHKPHADSVVVRGTMGAFANRCRARYGRKNNDFPFRHWYVDGGFARYLMPSKVADVLRPLRDG
jgi:hypothetical protein